MSDISFDCVHCGKHLVVDESGAGLTIACPSCGQPLAIPSVSVSQPGSDSKGGLSVVADEGRLVGNKHLDARGEEVLKPTRITEASTKPSQDLTREQFLSALDSEISMRENQASRLGYSEWALKVAFVAILWAAVNEIAKGNHTRRGTLLIFFAGWVMLAFLTVLTGNKPKQPVYEGTKGSKYFGTFRELIIKRGFHPDTMLYVIAECLGLLAIAVVLGHCGFVTLSVIARVILFCFLVVLVIVLALCFIRIPIRIDPKIEAQLPKSVFCANGALLMVTLVLAITSIITVVAEWSSISSPDLHLGLLLTGLMTILGVNVQLANPAPDLVPLKSIRGRVAFGWLDLETAKEEVENILLGFPNDHYVASKAIQYIDALEEIRHHYEGILAVMQQVMRLATKLKESIHSQTNVAKALDEINRLDRKYYYKLKEVSKLGDRASRFKKQLDLRLKIAETHFDIADEEIKHLLAKVTRAQEESASAWQSINDIYQSYMRSKEAWSRQILSGDGRTISIFSWRDVVYALFRD